MRWFAIVFLSLVLNVFAQASENLIAIFDLDDTLFDSRVRTIHILKELTYEEWAKKEYPAEVRALSRVKTSDIQYHHEDTMHRLGIQNLEFIEKVNEYWKSKFFSNAYVIKDRVIPGAVAYVNALARSGVRIIYLTGRDKPGLSEGTKFALRLKRFPTDRGAARLIMKPDTQMNDVEFKKKAFKWIAKQGRVVAFFENEPQNLNAMAAAFPEAKAIFLETIHSNKPVDPVAKAIRIKDFYKLRMKKDI